MRVWVSGALGFVGRRLATRLDAEGHHVAGVDREVEIRDPAQVARSVAAAEPHALIHLAAQSSGAGALRDPAETARINTLGSLNVLEAVRSEAPKARVLMISSGEVYGSSAPGSAPFRESDPLRPGSVYGRTKASADRLAERFAEEGLEVLRLRPFNHTGGGQDERFVAPSFARQVSQLAAGEAEPVLRVGNLDSVRDFLHVDDVVEAYVRLLDPAVPVGAYNVASGVGRRIGELLDTLLSLAGVEASTEVDPERFRPTDCAVGDASLLKQATGWAPRRGFEETLSELLDAAHAA